MNGHDLAGVDLGAFRQRVSIVAQDTQLFAGSLRDNLVLAKPGATDDECRAALGQASASVLLERGTEGLDSRIGEGGLTLSGGERSGWRSHGRSCGIRMCSYSTRPPTASTR